MLPCPNCLAFYAAIDGMGRFHPLAACRYGGFMDVEKSGRALVPQEGVEFSRDSYHALSLVGRRVFDNVSSPVSVVTTTIDCKCRSWLLLWRLKPTGRRGVGVRE